MTRNDIDRIYTDKVTELLAKGFTIHTASMGGSQGEIAHTDLSDGSRIYRVLMETGYINPDNITECIVIRVGIAPAESEHRSTIWNNSLTTLSEITLAKVTANFYTTPDKAAPMLDKRYSRHENRHNRIPPLTGDAYKSVALRWLRKQPHMRTCRLEDIHSIMRTTENGRVCYSIIARGKTFLLHA